VNFAISALERVEKCSDLAFLTSTVLGVESFGVEAALLSSSCFCLKIGVSGSCALALF
jgi:hypothetical protein